MQQGSCLLQIAIVTAYVSECFFDIQGVARLDGEKHIHRPTIPRYVEPQPHNTSSHGMP